jgi:hypothetical protein
MSQELKLRPLIQTGQRPIRPVYFMVNRFRSRQFGGQVGLVTGAIRHLCEWPEHLTHRFSDVFHISLATIPPCRFIRFHKYPLAQASEFVRVTSPASRELWCIDGSVCLMAGIRGAKSRRTDMSITARVIDRVDAWSGSISIWPASWNSFPSITHAG